MEKFESISGVVIIAAIVGLAGFALANGGGMMGNGNDPEGRVALRGEIWTATASNETITTGNRVKIVAAKDLALTVSGLGELDAEVL